MELEENYTFTFKLNAKFIGKTPNTKPRNKSTRDASVNYVLNFWSYKIHNRFKDTFEDIFKSIFNFI